MYMYVINNKDQRNATWSYAHAYQRSSTTAGCIVVLFVHRMLNGTCTEFGSETPLSERQSQTSHRKPGFMKYEIHSTCTVEGILPGTSKSTVSNIRIQHVEAAFKLHQV